MKSQIIKRSIVVGMHKTSVSLEDAFWRGLKEIARSQRMTLADMVAKIDRSRQHSNLSSAIRLFVLDQLSVTPTNYSADQADQANRVDRVEADDMIQGNLGAHV